MSDDNKPIGWWLKEVDRLLEESFERVLADDGLTRRQWQALNAAARSTSGNAAPAPGGAAQVSSSAAQEPVGAASAIAVALAPFLSGDPAEFAAVIDPLVERGWFAGETLTADGERALQALTAKVRAQRARITAGISDAEYLATVDVLRRMAGNLT